MCTFIPTAGSFCWPSVLLSSKQQKSRCWKNGQWLPKNATQPVYILSSSEICAACCSNGSKANEQASVTPSVFGTDPCSLAKNELVLHTVIQVFDELLTFSKPDCHNTDEGKG